MEVYGNIWKYIEIWKYRMDIQRNYGYDLLEKPLIEQWLNHL